jgi:outer membrane protein assembly factor BamB
MRVRAIATTICWGFGVWIVAAQPQGSVPPVPQSAPSSDQGNAIPLVPPRPFKAKWNLTLPAALSIKVATGPDEFFVGTDAGSLSAYAVKDAQRVWTLPIAAQMLAAGDRHVFVSDGQTVRALDQFTGNQHWSIETGPLAVRPTWLPGWLLTEAQDGTIAAWRVSDGGRIWQQKLPEPASAQVAVDGGRIFVPLIGGDLVCLNLTDGAINWTIELEGAGLLPTATAERVFLGTSAYTFYSVKQKKGDLEWPAHRMIRSTLVGRPLLDERFIWITTADNHLQALSRGNGQIELRLPLPSRPWEQFVINGGQVIVPLASGELMVFDQRDGDRMASPTAPSAASPVAAPAAPVPPGAPAPGASVPAVGQPAAGTRLASPLLIAGAPGAPVLLRFTLDPAGDHIVTAFEREPPPADAPPAQPDVPASPATQSR